MIPGSGRSPGEGVATHSSILAWRNPWTEEPDWLQSMGLREFDTKERLNTNMHASGVLSEVIWHPLFLCLGISIPPIELVYQSKIANEIFWLSQCAVFELKSSRCHHGVMTALFFFFFFSFSDRCFSLRQSDPTTHTRSPG